MTSYVWPIDLYLRVIICFWRKHPTRICQRWQRQLLNCWSGGSSGNLVFRRLYLLFFLQQTIPTGEPDLQHWHFCEPLCTGIMLLLGVWDDHFCNESFLILNIIIPSLFLIKGKKKRKRERDNEGEKSFFFFFLFCFKFYFMQISMFNAWRFVFLVFSFIPNPDFTHFCHYLMLDPRFDPPVRFTYVRHNRRAGDVDV